MEIRPYSSRWKRELILKDGSRVTARWIRPDDVSKVRRLLQNVDKEDLRLRFFIPMKEFTKEFITKLTQLDYSCAIAFVALNGAADEIIGVVRLHRGVTSGDGEFAILVRSDVKGRGLGWELMQLIIEYARLLGMKSIAGQILQENTVMLTMCRELGFEVKWDATERGICNVTLALGDRPVRAPI